MNSIENEPWYSQNAVPMRPWEWAVRPFQDDPIELVSYPWQAESGDWWVIVRIKPGDSESIAYVPARDIRTIKKEEHPWWQRPRKVVASDPCHWIFEDELP